MMKKITLTTIKSSTYLVIIILAAGELSGRVLAETEEDGAAERPRRMLEEVIVTAQKREQNLRDVPIAINAFSGDTLTKLAITDVRDLQRLVPGFNANESGRNTTLFTLRGVGFTDTTYTATNTVGTYIDEVGLPYSVMTRGANLDIQRVEVLKGPQGTLYGRNTTGGLINYTTNPPTDEFEAGTTTSFGRFETLETENYISGPLSRDLAGRIAIKIIHAGEGWQRSNTRDGDTLGEKEKFSGRASLDWTPSDDLFIRFRIEGWRDRSDPHAPQAVGIIPGNPFLGELGVTPQVQNYPYVSQKGADPRVADWPIKKPFFPGELNDTFKMGSIKLIYSLSESMEWTTIVSYLDMSSKDSPQLQGLNITNTDLVTNASITSKNLEMRLSDRWFDERFYWSIGFNVSDDDAKEHQFADTTNAGALFSVAGVPGVFGNPISDSVELYGKPTIKQHAIFINTDTDITDTLSLNVGARYTENNQDFFFCATEPVGAVGPLSLSNVFTALSVLAAAQYTLATGELGDPRVVQKGDCFSVGEDGNNDPFTSELNEQNFSGRLALSWQPDGENLYYASLSRGFKAGGFPVLNPARKAQLIPVVQEELLAYELGTKLTFLDRTLNIDLAGFYYDYKDKQLITKTLDQVFGPLPILQNAPKSNVIGVELGIQYSPIDGLVLAFAGSHIKTEIDEFVGTNSVGEEQDFAGKPFNFAPETQFSVLVEYAFPITQDLEIGAGGDYYYSGDTNGAIDQNSLLEMDDYYSVGARLRLGRIDDKWHVSAFGKNLTNELINLGSNSFSEIVTRATGMSRTYGVRVQYRWE